MSESMALRSKATPFEQLFTQLKSTVVSIALYYHLLRCVFGLSRRSVEEMVTRVEVLLVLLFNKFWFIEQIKLFRLSNLTLHLNLQVFSPDFMEVLSLTI